MRRLLVVALTALTACGPAPDGTPRPATSGTGAPAPSPSASAPLAAPSAEGTGGPVWQVLGPAPIERIEMATAAHRGEIWLIGGLNADGSATAQTWTFDPSSGEWTEGPAVDEPIHHAAAVSTGDELYVIGGYVGNAFDRPRTTVLVLNEGARGWRVATELPAPRAAGAAAWDGSRIVYAGGVGVGVVADVLALTPDDGEWVRIGAMRAPREHLSAASDGEGRVWLLGGRSLTLDTNTGAVDLVEGLVVSRVAELPTPRGGAAAFHLPGLGACLAGGEQPDRALDAVECVNADGSAQTLPPLALAVHGHGAAVVDGAAHVMLGGPQPLLTVSDTVQRLAP